LTIVAPTPIAEPSASPPSRVPDDRIGGLDGLRAIAVGAVVVYHQWPDALPAGFLGVDLFMVLSGFLITGLLLDERARTGAVRLGAFWLRRFRRLVPALLALLAVVAIWVQISGPAALKPTVRGQGVASLLYVGNWKLVSDSTSYASLSDPPSPLLHLWSLAIEEQFYVLWPLVVVGVLALARGRRRPLALLAIVGTLASAGLMAAWFVPDKDPLRLYYGTDTRAQAFLIGALAMLATRRYTGARARRRLRWAGLPAFAVMLAAFTLMDAPGSLYRGGFAAFALVAAVVVVAVTEPGPLARLLDRGPLRLIGRVSYGIYLWHWPIIVLVTERTVPAHGVALLALRVALIAGATALSWCLIERPYKRASRIKALRFAPCGIAAAAACVLALPGMPVVAYASFDVTQIPTPVVVAPPTSTSVVTSSSLTPLVASSSTSTSTSTSAPALAAPVEPPKTVLVIGDSGMYDATPALSAGLNLAGAKVIGTAYPGEGLTQPAGVRDMWATWVRRERPDLVVVMLGAWDTAFIAANGDEAYQQVVDETVGLLTARGARVLWLSELPGHASLPGETVNSSDEDRFFAALPSRYPDVVDYLDIRSALIASDGAAPRSLDGHLLRKPDGWHLCPDGAAAVAHKVLSHLGLDGPGWDTDLWRTDARYDNPPGGCPG
jgi:peptidoglycan/LPS O-acetylase OafA/YrhL